MPIPFATPSMLFSSRSKAKNYIRDNILHAYPVRVRIPVGEHDQLLREVLALHSDAEEKIGSGIDYFYIEETWRLLGKEAVSRKQRAIIVVRKDGTERDWSYLHVIDRPVRRRM
ncbi:DCL family protein [Clavibacter michiganensis]|uniref:DCL family protein n=1 Tax=Clavibacter michiganensis TaxID=28447 RepID=UPI000B8D0532|nr:DCL family protein [Clavibacter michiganensis]